MTVAEDDEYDEKVGYDSSLDQMSKIFSLIHDEIKPSLTELQTKIDAKNQVKQPFKINLNKFSM